MATVRQNILANIKTVCEGITGVNNVFVNEVNPVNIQIHTPPLIFIDSISADRDFGDEAFEDEVWRWRISVEVIANGGDLEDWLGLLHDALMLQPSRGGNAEDTERLSDDQFDLDDTDQFKRLITIWEILYFNDRGLSSSRT